MLRRRRRRRRGWRRWRWPRRRGGAAARLLLLRLGRCCRQVLAPLMLQVPTPLLPLQLLLRRCTRAAAYSSTARCTGELPSSTHPSPPLPLLRQGCHHPRQQLQQQQRRQWLGHGLGPQRLLVLLHEEELTSQLGQLLQRHGRHQKRLLQLLRLPPFLARPLRAQAQLEGQLVAAAVQAEVLLQAVVAVVVGAPAAAAAVQAAAAAVQVAVPGLVALLRLLLRRLLVEALCPRDLSCGSRIPNRPRALRFNVGRPHTLYDK